MPSTPAAPTSVDHEQRHVPWSPPYLLAEETTPGSAGFAVVNGHVAEQPQTGVGFRRGAQMAATLAIELPLTVGRLSLLAAGRVSRPVWRFGAIDLSRPPQ